MRLGELLVAADKLTSEQVVHALRAQVIWGGRLGTNLVELALIDLDSLSGALARQHKLPAALARHFSSSNRELQLRLPAELAETHTCVPLLRSAETGRVVIAACAPLGADALAAIARALGVEPARIIVSIAAELRIRYYLERVYRIERPARFLRSGDTPTPFPKLLLTDDAFADEEPSFTTEEPSSTDDDTGTGSVTMAFQSAEALLQDDDDYAEVSIEHALDPQTARETLDALAAAARIEEVPTHDRRSYVPRLADEDPAETRSIGRIATHRVAIARGVAGEAPSDIAGETLERATRSIRRSRDRDRVADLAIDALRRWVPGCVGASFLVVRGHVATSWKGFSRSGESPAELSVPCDVHGIVATALNKATTQHARAVELPRLDRQLLASFGVAHSIAVVPITIAGQVMAVIAVAFSRPEASTAEAEAIAVAAGTAFTRLMRDAAR